MPELPRTAPYTAPPKPRTFVGTHPTAGRLYDFYLGGSSHFRADRQFGTKVLRRVPFVQDFARSNRAFLRRAVSWQCRHGIDQFLDIGSGIPTVGSVHGTAQTINPQARTMYVDYEPMTVANAEVILSRQDPAQERTKVLLADLRDPDDILGSPAIRGFIDFSRPVGLLIVATLHFLGPGDRPAELLARYRDALPAGSYLTLSHLTLDGVPADMWEQGKSLEQLYASTPTPGYYRDRAEFTALFDGFDLVKPGVVWAPQWHPEEPQSSNPAATGNLVGVGRKR